MKWKTDVYDIKAKLFPSIASLFVPAILYGYIFSSYLNAASEIKDLFFSLLEGILPSALLFSALGFFLQSVNQIISKYLFQAPFFGKDGAYLPTTNNLYWNNLFYSSQKKTKIYTKIQSKYGISIQAKKVNKSAEANVRKDIVDAVNAIRNDYRKNKHNDIIIDNYNIQFGFSRNFLGGSIISASLIILLILLNMSFEFTTESAPFVIAIVFFTFFEAAAILMLDKSSKEYADSLLSYFETQM